MKISNVFLSMGLLAMALKDVLQRDKYGLEMFAGVKAIFKAFNGMRGGPPWTPPKTYQKTYQKHTKNKPKTYQNIPQTYHKAYQKYTKNIPKTHSRGGPRGGPS